MHNATTQVPTPINAPVTGYLPGTPERATLVEALTDMAGKVTEIPCIIGGERVTTGTLYDVVQPHNTSHVLAKAHLAGPAEMARAIDAAAAAKREWEDLPWDARAAVLLRAAELLDGKYRPLLNASTMLAQSKTCHQAEIDASCELIDFWRFNCHFAQELYSQQPHSGPGMWNRMQLRALEGFVLAVTPFNFTSIGANLATAPALMGNTVVWKPSEPQLLSAYYTMLLLEEAGMPPGVINFVPGLGPEVVPVALGHRDLAGLHFTGSTHVFRSLWKAVAENIAGYRGYPRLVGETGGKDFIVAHPSADDDALVTAIIRGGYEYQGQKCSAASRVYVSESQWGRIRDRLVAEIEGITMGDPTDFRNFMGAVIKQDAFDRHKSALAQAKSDSDAAVIAGGECDDSQGYFVRPSLVQAKDPAYRTMREELFGPIVTAYVYSDGDFLDTLQLVDTTSPYALTGAIFAQDRRVIDTATRALRHSAGNFYINDKPTGAVVGQQPFGGARASGTNDKAGAPHNLLRWTSPRTLKETFAPPTDYRYPFMVQ